MLDWTAFSFSLSLSLSPTLILRVIKLVTTFLEAVSRLVQNSNNNNIHTAFQSTEETSFTQASLIPSKATKSLNTRNHKEKTFALPLARPKHSPDGKAMPAALS